MKLDIYQVDAFTDRLFGGNPAAVCPLEQWLSDDLLQYIAVENNLSETVFFVKEDDAYHIRWFTPASEVKLCGHATLASAYVLFNCLDIKQNPIQFNSLSGPLYVTREENGSLTMEFPRIDMEPCSSPQALWESLGAHPVACLKSEDIMAVFDDEKIVKDIQPDFRQMSTLPYRGVIVTAPGKECDFVSRFFAPRYGIDEDPVTGSAHCATAPYWAKKLERHTLTAIQRSKREGHILCHVTENRVHMTGQAKLFLSGSIHVE
jgi:PhzF family phenazine biosynthesis protein